ncbi:poly-beta-1,6-N-acetyl-D-glucosamine biosynthesis protein PgaD [Acinetobacter pollinis]|uniref:Poly-beta-1,6-N-acetyl-D-glucosamine biosynthesis protein PgaD n=2 Tax=Acinetobacter pollinis TaxID=2605270 RepID=A0ABU6DTS9_9GAMM|nr:poly-beta-1,6-N-acetyl-D-glucosamine biosynthesis protein PgaD [Acinetobacter pollinis]
METIAMHNHPDQSSLDIPKYIDKPHFVRNKLSGYVLQCLGWLCFMLLLFPLITLLLWFFEIKTIQHYIFIDGLVAKKNNILKISLAILICSSTLIGWASYNWLRFRKNERRKKPENISNNELARQFYLKTNEMVRLQKHSNITLEYDMNGVLVKSHLN